VVLIFRALERQEGLRPFQASLSNFGQTKNVKMRGVTVSVPFELMPSGKRVHVGVKAGEKTSLHAGRDYGPVKKF